MNNKLIIALDQGSSSSRVLAFDQDGQTVSRSVRVLKTHRPQKGWAEFDAAEMLHDQLDALADVLEQEGVANVAAIAVASQRSSIIFWDKLTGKPVAPGISWQDGRAMQQDQEVTLPQETIHQLTGLYKTPFYSAPKIAWAIEHIPAVSEAARKQRLCVGPVASFLIWHLTEGKVFACDPTLAQRTLLFNISTGDWDAQLLEAYGVRREWLPQIKHTVDDYGMWQRNGLTVPVRVCVGDQQAALQAQRMVGGGACINYGTGAFFMRHTGHQCHLLPGLLTSVAATVQAGAPEYLLEGPVFACGTVFNWLNEIGFSMDMDELDDLCKQSKHPVDLLPALGGLGAPYWDFKASPVLAGFSAQTTRADVAAGAVQALSLLLADIVFYAERCGIKSGEVKVSGGLAKSQALLQAQADILQTRLLPCMETESTAAGAALLAASAVDMNTSQWETFSLMPAIEPHIKPEEAQAKYTKWHDFLNWCKLKK